jgi:hypothetical protein
MGHSIAESGQPRPAQRETVGHISSRLRKLTPRRTLEHFNPRRDYFSDEFRVGDREEGTTLEVSYYGIAPWRRHSDGLTMGRDYYLRFTEQQPALNPEGEFDTSTSASNWHLTTRLHRPSVL